MRIIGYDRKKLSREIEIHNVEECIEEYLRFIIYETIRDFMIECGYDDFFLWIA